VFTGIVEEVGRVERAAPDGLVVAASLVTQDLRPGDSIAVDGACLTVVRCDPTRFAVGLQPETLRRTTLGRVRPGERVNLERALPVNGRFGGHVVQGHVDATGTIAQTQREADAIVLGIAAPPEVMRYVVPKGFIAVDGISLTVVDVAATSFVISLIRYTQQHVVLPDKSPGDAVNLEVDILAKYVERFVIDRPKGSGLTLGFLAEHGFA
jgi:riboflavin synthase